MDDEEGWRDGKLRAMTSSVREGGGEKEMKEEAGGKEDKWN